MSRALLKDLNTGKEYLLDGDTSIGRHFENDIVISDNTVSGIHAKITNVGASWYISDCNSRNGIEMNNFRIPAEGKLGLRNGCTLKLGDSFLSFTADESAISKYIARKGEQTAAKERKIEYKAQQTPKPAPLRIPFGADSNNGPAPQPQPSGNQDKKPKKGFVFTLISIAAVVALVLGWCLFNHSSGNKYFLAEDYALAVDAYRKDFLFSGSDKVKAAMLAGEEAYSAENYTDAAMYFGYAGEEGRSRWSDAIYESALQEIKAGNPDSAMTLLYRISGETRAQEQIGVAQLATAQKQFEDGKWEQAIATAHGIQNTTYADVNAFCDLVYHSVAEDHFEHGEYINACEKYGECLNDSIAQINRQILEQLLGGEYEKAATLADDAIQNKKTDIKRIDWSKAFTDVIGDDDPYLAKLGDALKRGEDIPTFFATVHHRVGQEQFLAGDYDEARKSYEDCLNDPAAEVNARILKLLANQNYAEAATLANSAIEEEITDLSRKQWQTCVGKYVAAATGISDLDKRLYTEYATAILAETVFDSSETTLDAFKSKAPKGSMIGSYSASSNSTITINSLDDLYSKCGSEAAGKILIVAQRHSYSGKTASQAVLMDMMRLLPGKYFPSSLAEVQYIVLVTYDYVQDGSYTHTTVSLRENGKVEVIRMPDKYKPYTSGTENGGQSPYTFMYSGSPPAWKSGDAPNMGASIHKALSTIIR